ncbi:TPA: helix-turn-helix domain-containing protein [Salmonella enterica subsp. enterica serovar Typhimurium]|nr:helix-turn-helix domain-containing protein [Salmonella enterica]HCR9395593.1 helix-turn-helix domain-containing protein [Salmonella enterica subsp. enterica serovar Typhimurium]
MISAIIFSFQCKLIHMRVSSCAIQILTGSHPLGAQAGRLIRAGVPRQQVTIIYDVGLSTLYRKFPVSKLA